MNRIVWAGIVVVAVVVMLCFLLIFGGGSNPLNAVGGTEYTVLAGSLGNKTIVVPSSVDLDTDEGACWLAKEAAKIVNITVLECVEISREQGEILIVYSESTMYAWGERIDLNKKEITFWASP